MGAGTPADQAGDSFVAVAAAVAQALGGSTVGVRVEADPNSGLTHFLDTVAERHARAITVRSVAAGDVRGQFAVALDLLGLPELAIDAGIGRRSFFEAGVPGAANAVAVEMLQRRSEAFVREPQLWVIDDAHLAGSGALAWLAEILRVGSLPLAVVYGTHDSGQGPLAGEHVIQLGPLGEHERAAAAAAAATVLDTLEATDGDGLLLVAAAVAGPRFDVTDVAALLGESLRACIAGLDRIERRGLIEPDGQSYRFVRGSDRRRALAAGSAPVRAALHAEFARLLMTRDDDPVRVAEHLLNASTRVAGDVDWLTSAAERVVRFDAHAATALLDRAAELTADPPRRLSMARARALSTVGRVAEAEVLADILLADAVGDEAAVLHRDRAMAYFHQGRAGDTVTAMNAAAECAADPRLHARFTAESAMSRLIAADFANAREIATKGSKLGEAIGDPVTVLAAEMVGCLCAFYDYDIDEATRLAERLETLGDLYESAEAALYQPWFAASLVRLELGQYEHCRRLNAVGLSRAVSSGHLWMAPAYDALDAYAAWEAGDFDDVVAHASAALAWRLDDTFGAAIWCHAFIGRVAVARGQLDLAEQSAAAARPLMIVGQAQFGWDHLALLDAELAIAQGRRAEAFAALREMWETYVAFDIESPRPRICVRLVPLLGEFAEPELAAAIVDDLAAAERRAGLAGFAADHAYAQAVLSGEVARMESVARRYADLGRHFRSGRTLVEAALLAEPHDRAEAARLATLAEGTLAPFRADGDLAPVRHLLAKRRGRPATGPNLSASERAVVGLVAEGLTNTEIAERLSVSRRTVESHVSSAYRKLGLTNRVELARAYADLA